MSDTGNDIPSDFGAAGAAIVAFHSRDYDIEEHERRTLIQACRTADLLERIAEESKGAPLTVPSRKTGDEISNPLFVEKRHQEITLIRLLASLRLPTGDEDDVKRPQRRAGARGSHPGRLRGLA